jgi:cell division protein FtsQ
MSIKARQAVPLEKQESSEWAGHLVRIVLVVMMFLLASWLMATLNNPETLPIKMVRAQGTFSHVTESMLQEAVGQVSGGYFNVDVARVQQAVETLPWVAQASVRRVWPDTLAISVSEQQALAYWKSEGLVNSHGEIFTPEAETFPKNLPYFEGPTGMNMMVTQYYEDAQQRLAPLGLSVTKVVFDNRRSLVLQLNHELELVLGKEQKTARLERFVRVYPKVLSEKINKIARVDLRYPHGMTVAWKKGAVNTQK